jgi:hypothetical protein
MVFCALNAMYFVATAGFVTGMYVAPPEARAMSAHGQRMAKKREKVRAVYVVVCCVAKAA